MHRMVVIIGILGGQVSIHAVMTEPPSHASCSDLCTLDQCKGSTHFFPRDFEECHMYQVKITLDGYEEMDAS